MVHSDTARPSAARTTTRADGDDGRAYGRPAGSYDSELVLSGPGTPGGELLRRYWQPVAASGDATDLPKAVRVLNEDLIVYRDRSGKPGLLYPRCAHRGASLLYGKVEEDGIRCCYHGWLFDAEGYCLDQPCEPDRGRIRGRIRQPWYPVLERFGLIFAYMGPASRQPLFPRFSFEDVAQDEEIVAVGSAEPDETFRRFDGGDFNWWQYYDNIMDPFHVVILHSSISGIQFNETLAIMPRVKWEYTKDGVRSVQQRDLGDGRVHQRISQTILPNMYVTASVGEELGPSDGVTWVVPIDDTHFNTYSLYRQKRAGDDDGPAWAKSEGSVLRMLEPDYGPRNADGGPKPWEEWTLEDHQRWPNDYEAQKGQGPITLHSEERLTSIDRGTVMLRRLFRRQARLVAEGGDPIGASSEEPHEIQVHGGSALLDASTLQCIAGFDGRPLLEGWQLAK